MKTPESGRRGNAQKRTDRRQRPGSQRPPGRPGPGAGRGRPQGKKRTRQEDPRLAVADARYLFGKNAVLESLRGLRKPPRRLWIAEGLKQDERIDQIRALAEDAGVPVETVPRMLLDDMTLGANHQGVVLDPEEYPYVDLDDLIESGKTLLMLDHLQDPQNFGSLIRAGDAVDIGGVILPQDRSVSVTPSVVNASAGAVEHVPVALVANLNRTLEKLVEAGYWTVGLAGEDDATDIFETDLPTPIALVVGAEGRGMSPSVRENCQLLLRLPMSGHVDSLNAATAGTVALYEIVRQQRT